MNEDQYYKYNETPQAAYLYDQIRKINGYSPLWNITWAKYLQVAYPFYTGFNDSGLSYSEQISLASEGYARQAERIK